MRMMKSILDPSVKGACLCRFLLCFIWIRSNSWVQDGLSLTELEVTKSNGVEKAELVSDYLLIFVYEDVHLKDKECALRTINKASNY